MARNQPDIENTKGMSELTKLTDKKSRADQIIQIATFSRLGFKVLLTWLLWSWFTQAPNLFSVLRQFCAL